MTAIEIALLVLGAIIFAASFVIPELKKEPSKEQQKFSEEEIKKIIEREMEHVRDRVDEVVEETIDYTMEKTERALAKVSNEKILAVNEYSDTVLEEINKNHKEVMFLYDMLNDKQMDLKNAVRKVEATKEEAVAAVAATATYGETTAYGGMGIDAGDYGESTQEYADFAPMGYENFERESQQDYIGQPDYVGQQNYAEHEGYLNPQDFVEERMPEPIFNRFAEGAEEPSFFIPETVEIKEVSKDGTSSKNVKSTVKIPVVKREIPSVTAQPAPRQAVQSTQSMTQRSVQLEQPMLQATAKMAARKPEVHKTRAAGGKNNNQKILEMHKEGKSNIAIAKELGLGLGEVKLVIDLFEGA